MSQRLRPCIHMSAIGGAATPATGSSCVRGSPVVGKVVTNSVTPLMPPQLAPIRNPICPWDAGQRWHRGFEPWSLTVRSTEPGLGVPTHTLHAPREQEVLVPAVSGGRLRFVVRPQTEVDDRGNALPRGMQSLHAGLETPSYLYATEKLPGLKTAPSPDSDGAPTAMLGSKPTPLLTPAHLLRNGQDDTMHCQKRSIFEPRRTGDVKKFGHPNQNWTTMSMEQSKHVYGVKAFW